jgi:hypothetical protein
MVVRCCPDNTLACLGIRKLTTLLETWAYLLQEDTVAIDGPEAVRNPHGNHLLGLLSEVNHALVSKPRFIASNSTLHAHKIQSFQ